MTLIADDTLVTPERATLRTLYEQRGIVPVCEGEGFGCANLSSCSHAARLKIITGSWAYVGTGYGKALVDGRPVKILFVAMDTGGKEEEAELSFANTQCDFRCAAERPSNGHMGSVHSLLRNLVDDKDATVFSRQFALTNAVKCRRATGCMETDAPDKMLRNCASHLEAEIEVLRPTLVITQGKHPAWTLGNSPLFAAKTQVEEFAGAPPGKAEVFRIQDRLILFTTPHSRVKGLRWREGVLPKFLLEAVERVRRELATIG